MPTISLDRLNAVQTAIVSLATFAAIGLLGLVLAYWTWAWIAPHPEPRVQAVADPVGHLAAANGLFGNVPRDRNIAAPTGIAIKLLGVAAASGDHLGHAVVQLDGQQILAVREGEDLAPGVRLAEVHADHIILERNGAREILAWPQKK